MPTVNSTQSAHGTGDSTGTWFGSYATFGQGGSTLFHLGLLFSSIAIPKGATIQTATLTLNVVQVYGGGSGIITMYGRAADNPAAFDSSNLPQNVTRTTANTVHSNFATEFVADQTDVTTIIQELVNRAGWASGNNIAIACIASGGAGSITLTGSTTTLSITYAGPGSAHSTVNLQIQL